MSLKASDVVNVQMQAQTKSAKLRDLSVIAIFTNESGDAFLDANTRYIVVSDADSVANRFGSNSDAYKAAKSVFSARPKIKTALIARFNKTAKEIEATANQLRGSTLSIGSNYLRGTANGSMNISVGGEVVSLTNLDFSKVTDFTDVAAVLTTALTANKIEAVYDETGNRIILRATTKGNDSTTKLGYAEQGEEGTYIGSLLKIEDGQADRIIGSDTVNIEAELPSDAMRNLENQYQDWYGAYFANTITDDELLDAESWIASANLKVMAYTATRESQLDYSDSNVLKKLAKKNSARLMVQYNNTGDNHAAAEMMAIALSTTWTGINTAKTVKFKAETSVTSDDRITINEANKCKALGINYYTDFSGVDMLAEGMMIGGVFIDETTGLDAFVDAVQKQAFTTMQGMSSKLAQTDRDQAKLIGAISVIGEQFVRNGFLAGGIWRGVDIGELNYGDRLDAGYYFYSDSFDTQSIAEREARKMMPISCALKFAGAGHFVDILVNFNR